MATPSSAGDGWIRNNHFHGSKATCLTKHTQRSSFLSCNSSLGDRLERNQQLRQHTVSPEIFAISEVQPSHPASAESVLYQKKTEINSRFFKAKPLAETQDSNFTLNKMGFPNLSTQVPLAHFCLPCYPLSIRHFFMPTHSPKSSPSCGCAQFPSHFCL